MLSGIGDTRELQSLGVPLVAHNPAVIDEIIDLADSTPEYTFCFGRTNLPRPHELRNPQSYSHKMRRWVSFYKTTLLSLSATKLKTQNWSEALTCLSLEMKQR